MFQYQQCWPWVLAVLLLLGGIADVGAEVRYVYDEGGRLVLVIAPNGESAHYRYDALGNMLAIQRYAAGELAIAEFTPDQGPAGTMVTLYGVGFSPTLADNLVTFNGAPALVSTASATQLVLQVPASATTGPIRVTVGARSATSTAFFIVTTEPVNVPPVITSFTPRIDTVDASVAIDGLNFESATSNNDVRFNGTRTDVASSTSTQIISMVPRGATSGRIQVRTPFGTAISAEDFFVLPAGYTVAQVASTTRLVVDGPPLSITTGAIGKIALVLFDGVDGQNLGLGISPLTFTPASGTATLNIHDPDGVRIFTRSVNAATSLDLPRLTSSGTYTLVIVPPATRWLQTTLTLSTDMPGTLSPGIAQTFSSTRIGQNARYSFSATTGTSPSLLFTANTFPGATAVQIYKPGDVLLGSAFTLAAGSTIAHALDPLPITGSYSIVVSPQGLATGSVSIMLQPEVTGTLAIDGVATAVPLSLGQNGRYTFTGSAGQNLGLGITDVILTPTTASVTVDVYKPDHTKLKSCGVYKTAGGSCDLLLLPTDGSYTVLVTAVLGTASLKLWLSTEVTGTLSPGVTHTSSITRAGQNARYRFDATAGQNMTLALTGNVFSGPADIYVYRPTGVQLATVVLAQGGKNRVNLSNLPLTGTYSVLVAPRGTATGAVDLTLQQGASGTLLIDGTATAANLALGQNGRYTFTGSTGQRLDLGITDVALTVAGNLLTVTISKPDKATLIACGTYGPAGGSCHLPPLPVAGAYTVQVNPALSAASFKLWLSTEVTGVLTPGVTHTLNIARPGQNARYSLNATVAQNLSLVFTDNTFPLATDILVYRPNGVQLGATIVLPAGNALAQDFLNLPVTGTYSVLVSPRTIAVGSLGITVQPEASGTVPINGAATAINLAMGQNGRYTFTGSQGQGLGLGLTDMQFSSVTGAVTVTVLKPDKTTLKNCATFGTAGGSCDLPLLPVNGLYTVYVNPTLGTTTFKLWLSAEVTGTLTAGGPVQTFGTTRVGQNARYSFSGTAAQTVSLVFSNDVFPGTTQVYVYRPNGTQLATTSLVYTSGTGSSKTLTLSNLPTTGTYSVWITPSGTATGAIDVKIP